MRRTPLKRKPWRKALGDPERRRSFKAAVLIRDGDCVMRGRSLCNGELQAAHVIPKHRLRKLGYGADVVYSASSAMCLCERHHNRHDRWLERVPYAYVPKDCKVFVNALGLAEIFERTA